jgi:phosphatidylethanolamine-binding protein (PEBP) family uncharacterized protein
MYLGRLLRPVRSGPDRLAGNDPRIAAPTTIAVSSREFASGSTMPSAYRGKDGVFPPISWSDLPPATASVVLIVEDVDVPLPQPAVHAIAYGIEPAMTGFAADGIPKVRFGGFEHAEGAWLGLAFGLAPGYAPPTPIPGHGPHRYVYEVFALDVALRRFDRPPSKARLLAAMAGHVLARGAVVGLAEA